MEIYLTICVFIFGTIFGSFYNVVGYRLPKGLSLVKPGSFCPKCNHALKWYELFPLFSFLFLRGRCRVCKCKISWFYPCIEFTTGVLFALSYHLFGFSYEFVLSIITASFFVIVIVSDITYLVIPDQLTIVCSLGVIITKLIAYGLLSAIKSVLFGIFAFAVMYIIMLLGNIILKKESLGGGDIKLMFFIGLLISSPINSLLSIFIASAFALPISLLIYFKNKDKVIPFGPFLLGAALLIFMFNIDIMFLFK